MAGMLLELGLVLFIAILGVKVGDVIVAGVPDFQSAIYAVGAIVLVNYGTAVWGHTNILAGVEGLVGNYICQMGLAAIVLFGASSLSRRLKFVVSDGIVIVILGWLLSRQEDLFLLTSGWLIFSLGLCFGLLMLLGAAWAKSKYSAGFDRFLRVADWVMRSLGFVMLAMALIIPAIFQTAKLRFGSLGFPPLRQLAFVLLLAGTAVIVGYVMKCRKMGKVV